MTSEKFLKKVQDYWDRQPCDSQTIPCEEGSLEFFEQMEENRYRDQAFIYSFAQFTRWQGKKVLEIGCGCGTDLLQFARAGAEIYGIDLSKHSLELTQKRLVLYGLTAHLLLADGENLPFPSSYFDLVYCWGVIHHTANPTKAVKEIHRVLKPGGFLKAMLYHKYSLLWIWRWFKEAPLKGRFWEPISSVAARYRESPGTKVFSYREMKALCYPFADIKLLPFVTESMGRLRRIKLGWLLDFYPRRLAAWVGIEAKKL